MSVKLKVNLPLARVFIFCAAFRGIAVCLGDMLLTLPTARPVSRVMSCHGRSPFDLRCGSFLVTQHAALAPPRLRKKHLLRRRALP